jgi:hypothetical protein
VTFDRRRESIAIIARTKKTTSVRIGSTRSATSRMVDRREPAGGDAGTNKFKEGIESAWKELEGAFHKLAH